VQKESAKEITKLINLKLSKLERQILKEYFNGKSYQEIAIKLNINKKSVDNGLNRIIKKLEKIRTK
jgi:RNA polymerase sporulation-specific sigma factor